MFEYSEVISFCLLSFLCFALCFHVSYFLASSLSKVLVLFTLPQTQKIWRHGGGRYNCLSHLKMKELSRTILFISALLVLLLAIPRKVHTLKVDIINTEASYYVDVLADKNKVDGEMPEYYSRIKETDEDTFNDLCILKNY